MGRAEAAVIEWVRLTRLKVPLQTPYKLAFGDVRAFDTVLAEVICAGSVGFGEATVLTGYTDETIDDAWQLARAVAATLPNQSVRAAKAHIESCTTKAPFTATMFTTAIEMAEHHPVLANANAVAVTVLFGLNATDFHDIDAELEAAHTAGFRTVKVKVGFDVREDLARVRHIQQSNRGRTKLRIDANQGYSASDAVRFATAIEPTDIELLEQPSHKGDWEGLAEVARRTNVPLMLDESIYNEEDIVRAADIGASFVKLKLMKFRSLGGLCAGLKRIRALGMEPVLGNGVASDIGCWMEACVARDLIRNAGEMNGFLRPRQALTQPPLQIRQGAIQLPANFRPTLNEDAMASMAVDSSAYG